MIPRNEAKEKPRCRGGAGRTSHLRYGNAASHEVHRAGRKSSQRLQLDLACGPRCICCKHARSGRATPARTCPRPPSARKGLNEDGATRGTRDRGQDMDTGQGARRPQSSGCMRSAARMVRLMLQGRPRPLLHRNVDACHARSEARSGMRLLRFDAVTRKSTIASIW
jgi:hypothetical protein